MVVNTHAAAGVHERRDHAGAKRVRIADQLGPERDLQARGRGARRLDAEDLLKGIHELNGLAFDRAPQDDTQAMAQVPRSRNRSKRV
jgi:hypothetical protein